MEKRTILCTWKSLTHVYVSKKKKDYSVDFEYQSSSYPIGGAIHCLSLIRY